MTPWALGLLLQLRFDWTISIGNIIAGGSFFALCLLAWRDVIWRVKNLEEWRKEHMIDSDARDKLIIGQELISAKLEVLVNSMSIVLNNLTNIKK